MGQIVTHTASPFYQRRPHTECPISLRGPQERSDTIEGYAYNQEFQSDMKRNTDS